MTPDFSTILPTFVGSTQVRKTVAKSNTSTSSSRGRSSSARRRKSGSSSRRPQRKRLEGRVNTSPVREAYTAGEPTTLLELVIAKSGRSRTAAKRLIASGRVSVAERPTTSATLEVPADTPVTVHSLAPVAPFTHPQISIEWEDDSYVVVYKKTGIATVNTAHKDPSSTVMHILSRHYKKSNPRAKLFMLTRLDKSSAGYVLFAKSIEAKERLAGAWGYAVQHQRFALIVEGQLPSTEPFELTAVSTPIDEERQQKLRARGRSVPKSSTVRAEVQPLTSSAGGQLHLVEADIKGSRIFSLRKVFGDNRLRIFGDIRYHSHFYARDQIALAQTELEITLPHTGETIHLRRPIPSHFQQLLRQDKES